MESANQFLSQFDLKEDSEADWAPSLIVCVGSNIHSPSILRYRRINSVVILTVENDSGSVSFVPLSS